MNRPVTDRSIEQRLLELLARRQPDASICPSEVARSLVPHRTGWRPLMPTVRTVAFALQRNGLIVVTRGSARVADEHDGTGPIRLRRGPAFPGQ